jgi:hypothetical protein
MVITSEHFCLQLWIPNPLGVYCMPKHFQNQSKIYLNPQFFIVFTKKTKEERKNCEKCRLTGENFGVFSFLPGLYRRNLGDFSPWKRVKLEKTRKNS